MAKVYGRFTEERDRWERIAATRDAEKWPGRVAIDVARGRGLRLPYEELLAAHRARTPPELGATGRLV